MSNRPNMPSPAELWQQAGGGTATFNRSEYRELLREHGHLIDGPPEPLPCGWTPGQAARYAEGQEHMRLMIRRTEGQELTAAEQARLAELNERALQRAVADPGKPDTVESLAARVGMTPDELRAAGAALRVSGHSTHTQQDDDGAWYDVPCDCPDREATR